MTGLAESCRDILVYGAMSQMIVATEAARLNLGSMESSARANQVQSGQATNVSKYYMQLYATRVTEEQNRLHQLYPTRIHVQDW